jgi:hypothetical protein
VERIEEMIDLGWRRYTEKVASKLLNPENEKMMQLQLALIYQTLAPLYECRSEESIKVLLEVPEVVNGGTHRIIDIVIEHRLAGFHQRVPIELKCFRYLVRHGKGKRGAQNLGMYDYWEDIENIEGYCAIPKVTGAYQFTLTDDPYYPETQHAGSQVATYSTWKGRKGVTGALVHPIANRRGDIHLRGSYDMAGWRKDEGFFFIAQRTEPSADALSDGDLVLPGRVTSKLAIRQSSANRTGRFPYMG